MLQKKIDNERGMRMLIGLVGDSALKYMFSLIRMLITATKNSLGINLIYER